MSYEVQVGWGKSVSLPPKPFYVAPDNEVEVKKFVPDPPSGIIVYCINTVYRETFMLLNFCEFYEFFFVAKIFPMKINTNLAL